MKILAGILAYRPNLEEFSAELTKVTGQVNGILVVDRGSENTEELNEMLRTKCKGKLEYSLLSLTEEAGFAASLNAVLQYAKSHGYDWFLLLDETSFCTENLTERYTKLLAILSTEKRNQAAVLLPVVTDMENQEREEWTKSLEYRFVPWGIAAGSLISTGKALEIGGFDPVLTHSLADMDFCYRARKAGYRVIQSGKAVLYRKQELGRVRRFLFWKLHVTQTTVRQKKEFIKALVYLHKKGEIPRKEYHNRMRKEFIKLFYGQEKRKNLKAFFEALREGSQENRKERRTVC